MGDTLTGHHLQHVNCCGCCECMSRILFLTPVHSLTVTWVILRTCEAHEDTMHMAGKHVYRFFIQWPWAMC
jgi:hypothetical protein